MIVTLIEKGKVKELQAKTRVCKLDPRKVIAMKQIREALQAISTGAYTF